MQLNFRDPAVICRLVISAFSGISVALLIAGTAVDEYVSDKFSKLVLSEIATGCRKEWANLPFVGSTTVYKSFEQMDMLHIIILICTSVLCLLQVITTVLNVFVLLKGKYQKPAFYVTSAVTVLLLTVIIISNISEFEEKAMVEKVKDMSEKAMKEIEKYRMKRSYDWGDANKELEDLAKGPRWGTSYALLCVAFSFAVLNQILIGVCQHMAGGGGFKELKERSVARVKSFVTLVKTPNRLARLGIVICTGILALVMLIGTASDRYIGTKRCTTGTRLHKCKGLVSTKATFKEMADVSLILIVLFGVTIFIFLLQIVSLILAILHLTKEKFEKLLLPLLALSVATTGMTITSLILVCIHFSSEKLYGKKTSWTISFYCLITCFVIGIFNAALNIGNMILTKKGGAPMVTRGTTSTAPTTGLPAQPSTCGNPAPSA